MSLDAPANSLEAAEGNSSLVAPLWFLLGKLSSLGSSVWHWEVERGGVLVSGDRHWEGEGGGLGCGDGQCKEDGGELGSGDGH